MTLKDSLWPRSKRAEAVKTTPFPSDAWIELSGTTFRPDPRPDMTEREAFFLALFFMIATSPRPSVYGLASYDAASAKAWLEKHGLLRHVEVKG